jgi:catechol 2,3-dioxygenase-like lactoylglutathione lyase family enzyme
VIAGISTEDRPMKIVITSVLVDDQDKALAFYRDVLGFVLRHDIPMGGPARWLTLTSPGDPDGVELLLSAAGVRFTRPPTHLGPVTIAVFDDTCGNLIQINQRH